jgi:hypothetical protein
LADGSTGWYPRYERAYSRGDDCFPAALATVLQVPVDELPDAHIDERLAAGEDPEAIDRSVWAELERWLEKRRLRIVRHRMLPVAEPRWLGICPVAGWFQSHALAMSEDQVLFDPVVAWYRQAFPSQRLRVFTVDDVGLGYSFRPLGRSAPRTKRRPGWQT